jgi:circadian clock protein KaiC
MEYGKKNKTGTIAETIELEKIASGSIIKVRGMARINQLSEFVLSKDDIQLPDVYKGREGVLFGSARMAQESDEEIERKKCELESKRKLMENGIAVLNEQYARRRKEKVLVGLDLIT